MIKSIVLFTNGMVAVLDDSGQQLSQLQGTKEQATWKLIDHDLSGVEFKIADYQSGQSILITKDLFFSKGWD